MKKKHTSKSVIFIALSANLIIAIVKFIVAGLTRSSAMLAEAIHSTSDTFNQVFLLIGIKKSERSPNTLHPFGFSGELYFWSFIVAIILFTAGGMFSIYEGIHKLKYPAPIENVSYALFVLGFAIIAEGVAFLRALKIIKREGQGCPIFTYLRKTKKSELIVVFLEDFAAITGLVIAFCLILAQHLTHILIFDGIASIAIGLILCTVAIFIGNEIRSLLIGESADPKKIKKIADILDAEESIERVFFIKSLQQGPDDILLSIKAEFNHRLTSVEISNLINGIEMEIKEKHPDVRKIFIEPDLYANTP